MKAAVFLDRDGTIIADRGYLSDPGGVELLPGATAALRRFQAAGYLLVLVSNQSAIGRGYCSRADVDAVNKRLEEKLSAEKIRLDGVYYCPHAPNEGCACRKPEPGLLLQAAEDLGVDLGASVMIGDKASDAEAGLRAGCSGNLVLSNCPVAGFATVRDLAEAADRVLGGGS